MESLIAKDAFNNLPLNVHRSIHVLTEIDGITNIRVCESEVLETTDNDMIKRWTIESKTIFD